MDKPLWQPSEAQRERSQLSAFARMLEQQTEVHGLDYASLHRFSVLQRALFWRALWQWAGIRGALGEQTLSHDRMPGSRWFDDSQLSFTDNLLRRRDDHPALLAYRETGTARVFSYRQLREEVARLAQALRRLGIGPGDCVAAWLPNMPLTVVALLASNAVGATFTSCSPDFGVEGAWDRFAQAQPRVLLVCDQYRYADREYPQQSKWQALIARLPSVQWCVVGSGSGDLTLSPTLPRQLSPVLMAYPDLCGTGHVELVCEQLPFSHPLYVLFTSGTTGPPKGIVHGAGGSLLQHVKEHRLHLDLTPRDTLFFYTSCGWMMWNWLVSALAVGCSLVLYDGDPLARQGRRLFDLVDQAGITAMGVSARYLAAIEKQGLSPRKSHRLERLRLLLSTGSPLLPEQFDYVYRQIGSDLQLASISGGTDLVSCFALANPWTPVYRGELQGPGLGMDVAVFNEQGEAVTEQPGELVCRASFPSMPLAFLNDPEGERYRHAYFSRFPGVWCQGDRARQTLHGGLVIEGRSDAVLNPGGVRIGTAEIYRQVEAFPEVLEALAVGQQWQGDVRIIVFVRLRPGCELTDDLTVRLRLREQASPRHVPAHILAVADLPRTRSGKLAELAVREVIHGRPVTNTTALANPEVLDAFRHLSALQT